MKQTRFLQFKKAGIICLAFVLAVIFVVGIVLPIKNSAFATSYTNVDTTSRRQTFEGWGTSLAWWANAVGGWTMEGETGKTKREEIMDLVFGADGLNLNIVRYNIPGGENPTHSHMKDFREMPLVKENSTSIYNWEADANQLWVLQQANAIRQQIAAENGGKTDIINEVFSNSAPYWMTNSQCVSGGNLASEQNLPVENYPMFATYIADYVNYLQNTLGIDISYVEPLNESGSDYWGANGTQEGMRVYEGENQSNLILAVYNELVSRGLIGDSSSITMTGLDETSTDLAVANWYMLSDEAKNVLTKINTHIYSHTVDDQQQLNQLAYGAEQDYMNPDYKLWMSEITYGAGEEPSATSMKYAMELAFDVQENLNVMGASAWIYWQAVESALQNMMYGNNYGLIQGVYQDVGNGDYGIDMDGLAMSRGDYFLTKQYYALGQYSRYIKQGYSIVTIENNVTNDVKVYNLAAISPDGTELVIVSTNQGGTEPINYYLKGFNATSCKKIVTSEDKNWHTTAVNVNGSYLSDTLEEESITTYVLKGSFSDQPSDDSGIYFSNFITRNSGLYAQYYITDAFSSYKLYYATTADQLPCNGGTTATSVDLSSELGEHTYTNSSIPIADNYFAVIEKYTNGRKSYSTVLEGKVKEPVTDDFVYFTGCGKTNKGSFAGTPGSFGQLYGVADQLFGTDPFSGMRWGLVSSDVNEYNSDDIFTACRYSDVDTLVYRYEVPSGSESYSVCLGFKDPWQTADRIMDVYVNGVFKSTVNGTKSFTTAIADGIVGVYDEELDGYFITIELKRNAETSQKPAVNFIAIQDQEQQAVQLGLEQIPAISMVQGQSLTDRLPTEVTILDTKGSTTSDRLIFDNIYGAEMLTAGGGTATVFGHEKTTGMTFEVNVGLSDPTVQVYYYIDFGATQLVGELQSIFEGIKSANRDTLINTDALDKLYVSTESWGRVGSGYSEHWANDPDKLESVIESGSGIRYWLPGIPAGDYVVEIGVNIHGWNISSRSMNFKMGDVDLGTISNYNDKEILTYNYSKNNDDPVMFECTSLGGEKPLLAYMIIKKVSNSSGEVKVETPELQGSVASTETTVTVTNLTLDALLLLRDDQGNVLADKVVTQDDIDNGQIIFTDLDLTGSARIEGVQFLDGKTSSIAVADVPQLSLTAPRDYWSTDADVIKVTASSEMGIDTISYKLGEDGEWINIKDKKFIRATENGIYYVRMVTKAGSEVIKQVEVTHVDVISMTVDNDLTQWVDTDVRLEISVESVNDIVSVKAIVDGLEKDITDSLSDGKYYLTVSKNCNVDIVAETNQGGTKKMNVSVSNIDKEGVKLDCQFDTPGGVPYVNMTAQSISGVTYWYSFNGGEFVLLNQPKVLLSANGMYTFKALSQVGKTDTFTINYSSGVNDKVTVEDVEGGVKVTVNGDGQLVRLDGDGQSIALDNNSAVLTQNGRYRVISTSNGTLEVFDFVVDSLKTDSVITGEVGQPTNLAWIWYVASAALFAVAIVLLIISKKASKTR